ncbi:Flp family type IVb pilin [Rhodopseudomonas palustris]|nr:Flp family type IVb pilin [Rhodopseudomonas pseudopalustris]MBB1091770.1 Flp family type IVb pilin [Rhodopseudomonas palustris]
MRRLISRFVSDTSGATAIEYAILAVGISIVIIGVVNGLGTKLNSSYDSVSSAIK